MSQLIDEYIKFCSKTEPPAFFHRWSFIACAAAALGRRVWLPFGHTVLYPNLYIMLLGEAGTRKSTAIKMAINHLRNSGYSTFAAEKTSKERFLLDLTGETEDEMDFYDEDMKEDAECFIAADEGMDFFGQGNIEFLATLGSMWDYSGNFESRIKNGKSANIFNPTLSMLSGFTPTNFSLSFPPEILGQGFFSRTLVVHAPPSGKKFAFPEMAEVGKAEFFVEEFKRLRTKALGEIKLEPSAKLLLEKIYLKWRGIPDPRFASYVNRRFTHLLKLCITTAALGGDTTLTEEQVIYTHTILTVAEKLMPRALGEFGKSKNSDIAHKLLQHLSAAHEPSSLKELWKVVSQDLEKIRDLNELLANLLTADKIQQVSAGKFLIKREAALIEELNDTIDYSLLTDEERNM